MKRLDLVFLWHMHQPDYRDHANGEVVMPWTYLHAIKDYTDMAGHFERHPHIKAVVNFVPVLLDQIDDYVDQFAGGTFRDPLLRLLATADLDHLSLADRHLLLEACFRANEATMLAPFPHFQRLRDLHEKLAKEGDTALAYLSGAYLGDLLTWYHLAWSGETERRHEPLLAALLAKGEGFTLTDRQQLLDWIGRTLAGVVPRYRALQARGQIEISATPCTHPLAPLMLDFGVARASLPTAPLPLAGHYAGGRDRVCRHIESACQRHAQRFGTPPVGMWPAEGGVSAEFLHLLGTHGSRWAATGENVLQHSLGQATPRAAYQPWQLADAPEGTTQPTLFFRDDQLSDLIGFEYAKWHGRDAAADFVRRLEAIAAATPAGETAVVSVILDGENAWEYYPYNAYYFFDDLYGLLEQHPVIRTRTYAEILDDPVHAKRAALPALTAGSWVHGTFSTWIGEPAKNHAWDLLCAAKQSYDQVLASKRLSKAETVAAEAQLAVCESSDWFWWFGDYNPGPSVVAFDRLFRRNLANLYRRLHLDPPAQLDLPISHGRLDTTEVASGGTMRRADAAIQNA